MDALKKNLNTAALVLVAAGLLGWIVWPQKKTFALAVLGLGLVALVAYIVLNRTALSRTFQRKSLLYSGNLALVVVLVLAILGLANYFLARHNCPGGLHRGQAPQPVRPVRHRAQGPQDGRLVQGLLPRRATAGRAAMESLLKLYAYHSPRVKYEFIDPDKNPGLVKRYDVTQDGTTVIEAGDKESRVTTTSEEDVTNALIKATRAQKKVLYFLEGHGEGSVDESGDNGYLDGQGRARKARLRGQEADAWPWPTASPRTAPCSSSPAPRKTSCRTNTRRSGPTSRPAAASCSWSIPETPTLLPLFLADYGFKLENDIVVDTVSRLLGGDYFMPVVTRVRAPRHHGQVLLRDVLPLCPLGRGRRDQARGGDRRPPWPRRAPTPGPSGELDQKEVKFTTDKDKQGPISLAVGRVVQDQARPPRRRPASQARRAARGQARAARREGSPPRRHRRFRFRQEPLLRPVRQRQFLPQRRQLAGRGVRPHRHPAQDPDAADAPAHALAGPADLPRQRRHPAPGRPPHRDLRLGPEEVAVKIQDDAHPPGRPRRPLALVLVFDTKGEEKKAAEEKDEHAHQPGGRATSARSSIVKNGQTLAFERDEAGPWRLTSPLQAAGRRIRGQQPRRAPWPRSASSASSRRTAKDPAAYEIPKTEVSLWVKGKDGAGAPPRRDGEPARQVALRQARGRPPGRPALVDAQDDAREDGLRLPRRRTSSSSPPPTSRGSGSRPRTSPGGPLAKGRAGRSRPPSPLWPPRARSMPSSIPSPGSGPRRSWPRKRRAAVAQGVRAGQARIRGRPVAPGDRTGDRLLSAQGGRELLRHDLPVDQDRQLRGHPPRRPRPQGRRDAGKEGRRFLFLGRRPGSP